MWNKLTQVQNLALRLILNIATHFKWDLESFASVWHQFALKREKWHTKVYYSDSTRYAMLLVGEKIEMTHDHFGDRVRKNHLIVDKSLIIEEFWEGPDVSLITRPRGFGKTLNLSMLQHFFAAEVHGQPTAGLFDNFSIAQVAQGQFIQQHQGKYPVLFISFQDIKEDSFDETISKINVLMQKLYEEYEKKVSESNQITDISKAKFQKYLTGSVNQQELENGLRFLSEILYKAYGKKTIILIDEYDSPLPSAYRHRFIHKLSNFLRNLFSGVLESNGFLEKGLMTGILCVSKNSMLSGLNNLKVYTALNERYSNYFGFIEEEVVALLKDKGDTQSLQEVRKYYNGYKMGSTVLYNPLSVMQYLDEKELVPYWVMTAKDQLLKKVLLNSPIALKQLLNELIQGKTIKQTIEVNLLYEDLVEKSEALWALLLFCGYLAVESSKKEGTKQTCQLRIPNAEVLQQYLEVFSEWLKEKIKDNDYNSFLNSLIEGRVEEFTQRLTRYLFSCTSSHDSQAEADYHSFTLGLLTSVTHTHLLYSNKEYEAGRPDCLLIPKDKAKVQGIILEFKHVFFRSEEDARREVSQLKEVSHASAQKGLEQIEMRGYSYAFHQHPHISKVLKVGIAFSNRMVSAAYTLSDLINGDESPSSSPEISFVDGDEIPEPVGLPQQHRLKRRKVLSDEQEPSFSLSGEAASFSAHPVPRFFPHSSSSAIPARSFFGSSHEEHPELTEEEEKSYSRSRLL